MGTGRKVFAKSAPSPTIVLENAFAGLPAEVGTSGIFHERFQPVPEKAKPMGVWVSLPNHRQVGPSRRVPGTDPAHDEINPIPPEWLDVSRFRAIHLARLRNRQLGMRSEANGGLGDPGTTLDPWDPDSGRTQAARSEANGGLGNLRPDEDRSSFSQAGVW